jgi:hypothetical protein
MLKMPNSDGRIVALALAGLFGVAACSSDTTSPATARPSRPNTPTSIAAGSGAPVAMPRPGAGGADGSSTPQANIAMQAPTSPSTDAINAKGSGTCEVVQLVAQPVIPEMMIVLDRSGSMKEKRWTPSVSAVRRITNDLQAKIHFGLALFPDPSSLAAMGAVNGLSQCFSAADPQMCIDMLNKQIDDSACAPGKIVVPIGVNNAAMIGKVLDMTQPSGGTPTSDTLARLVNEYANAPAGPDDKTSAKYVLLVTDGAPTCPAGMGQDTTQPDIDASNAAIEALLAKGVKTYVIGYNTTGAGNEMLASVLDGLAQRGGTGDKMHRPVEDEASLSTEFMRITASIASCRFELSAPPQRADYVLVRIDGKQVNLNDPDGFQLIGDRSVELQGAACATFREGQHLLDAQVQCKVVQPM